MSEPLSSWPARKAICLDCRTTLERAQACPASARHRVTDLDTTAGREALLSEVWGPSSLRRRAREMAKASGGGVAGGAAADGCSSCSGCDAGGASLEGLVVILVVALVVVVLYYAIKWGVALWRRHNARLQPRGALSRGPRTGHGHGLAGTVIAQTTALAPMLDTPCVAYGVYFHHKRWWRDKLVMLRDAATVGFDVELDSGERVRIPAGIIALDPRGATAVKATPGRVEDYVLEFDRLRRQADSFDAEHDPMLHTSITAHVIEPGARVQVHGPLESRPDPHAVSGGYREQAATVLVPVGVPRLVRVPS